MIEGFRGSTKSTDGLILDAFLLGHTPHGSGLIVGATDDAAGGMSALLATIIEFSPSWKATFPTVVPDKERGWGMKGYWIKDSSIPYDKWQEKCFQDHGRDPSFVGHGIESSDIVGMHPSLFEHVDDIHNEKNTSSPREMQSVLNCTQNNLMPTMSRPAGRPFIHWRYTPWKNGDTYQIVEGMGVLKHIKTPVYVEVGKDDDGAVLYDSKWVKFAWPKNFGPEWFDTQKKLVNNDRVAIALMFMLDREAAISERIFKYYPYRNEMINFSWPMVTGADYASVHMPTSGRAGMRSHFALGYGLKTPEGGVVIADGVVEQCTQLEAEQYGLDAQRKYLGFLNMVVEIDGKGEDYYQLMARHPEMHLIPSRTGGKHKADRLWRLMSGWFEIGKVRVSDANTKYLNLLRSFLDKFPNLDIHAPEWDVADSVYLILIGMPDVLQMPIAGTEMQSITPVIPQKNPWAAAGRVL